MRQLKPENIAPQKYVYYHCVTENEIYILSFLQGADKSLARPRMKQANVSVRMAGISVGALPCRGKKL